MLRRILKYIRRRLYPLIVFVYKLWGVEDHGKNNRVVIGAGCNLSGTRIIFNGNNNNVIIGKNCSMPKSTLHLLNDNNTLIIGDNNDWGENVNVIPEEGTTITICSDCQIAVNVVIRSSDGHSIISNETNKRINPGLDISIGDRCWLGEDVKVLKGAMIHPDCIIGASAIVTKGVYESNSVYVGNPIRQVKKNVHWIAPRI